MKIGGANRKIAQEEHAAVFQKSKLEYDLHNQVCRVNPNPKIKLFLYF